MDLTKGSSSSHSSTHRSIRQFNGPSDKKQYYIGEFISQISKSDPENKHFSKVELMEANNALRKAITSNPHLYRLIQSIVDECIFVDEDILEMMKIQEKEDLADVTEDFLSDLNDILAEQEMLKQLCSFNSVQISNRKRCFEKFCKTKKGLISMKTVNQQINEGFAKSFIGNPVDTMISEKYFRNILSTIQGNLTDFNNFMKEIQTLFKYKLINTDQTIAYLLSEDVGRVSLCDTLESNRLCKEKYLVLLYILRKLESQFSNYEHELETFLNRKKLESDLKTIKCEFGSLLQQVLVLYEENPVNASQQLMDFFQKPQSVNPDKLISAFHQLENDIIMLGTKINRLKCSFN